jgi:hypothetical protein
MHGPHGMWVVNAVSQRRAEVSLAVPLLRSVEKQIERVEGFRVAFLHHDRRDVRGDMHDVASYEFARKLSDDRTVAEWIAIRFRERYRGFEVSVLLADGSRAHGNTLLSTVRASYS